MADIYLARSTSEAGVERHVVLKRVLAERSRDAHLASMFLDEARLAAQLQHPNIAQVHDIGRLGESYFYTMEYVHGQDLRAVLRRCEQLRRALTINLALHIQIAALAGLQHAHTRTNAAGQPLGIVHRDITPSNVMVSYEGQVKLLDFGVAKATERKTETNAGTIKGKIGYLSPEQAQSKPSIDRRSDIFSAGIVLYEMLTIRRLFKRESDFNTLTAIVSEEIPPPSSKRPEISAALDAVVMKALAKDPAARYQSAAEFIEAIEEVVASEHHVLSGTALGRFMREMFGERPEPWLELQKLAAEAATDTDKPRTITSENPLGIEVRTMTMLGKDAAAFLDDDAASMELSSADLEAQLEQAPTLHQPDADLSLPVSTSGSAPGSQRSQWANTPPPMPRLVESALARGPQARLPTTPVTPPSSRSTAWFIGVLGLMLGFIIVFAVTRSSKAPANDKQVASAGPVADAMPASPPDAAEPPDAAVDAPAAPTTIADAVTASAWTTALELCAASPPARDDRVRCGIAACNARQKKAAQTYWAQVTTKADKAALATACKNNEITLAPAVSSPPRPVPSVDPCKNRSYAERNPLRCQK